MNKIEETSFISNIDGAEFYKNLCEAISNQQNKGLEVEVQYSTSNNENDVVFTALVLGRCSE